MEWLSNFILKHIGSDGLMHFCISAIVAWFLSILLPGWMSFAIVVLCGIAKEIYDKVSKKGTPEWKDLLCDLAGSIVGAIYCG